MATQNFNFKVKNGIDAGSTITAPAFVGDGSLITNINTANISTGVLPLSRGGTGVTTSTGSGDLVFSTSPTLVTPIIGSATATTINKVTVTAPSTGATLTLANGSTLATSGSFSTTLTSTGATNVTLPTSGTLATVSNSEILSNKTMSWSSNTFSGTVSTIGSTAIPAQSSVSSLSGLTNVSSGTITSTVASGTAPFTVTSSTKVVNLNADLLDGYDSSDLGKVANDLTQFATTTSTAFRGKINGTTGTSNLVFSDSPTFVGTPVAPDYSGSGSSQLATINFVNTSLANFTPTTGDGTSLGTLLNAKANVNSPIFTGTPVFPNITNGKAGGSLTLPNSSYDPSGPASGDLWAKSNSIKWYDGTNTNTIAFLTSNVASASKLQTARTITATGDISWTGSFDGSANVSGAATLSDTGVSSGSYGSSTIIPSFTVDSKGRLTSVTNNSVTFGNATLTLSKGSAGATNTDVTIGTGTGFSANATSNATYDVKVGPALTALATLMTGATSGIIKKSGQDSYSIDNSSYAGSSTSGGAANSVASSQVIKFDTGTTEGTDLYTFNGSSAKTIDIKAGTNITLTKAANTVTISASTAAATATKLASSRLINGVAFDGTADITVPVSTTQKSDNVSYNIPFVSSVTAGNQSVYTDNEAVLTYNPSTNTLSAGTFNGTLTGNASSATYASNITITDDESTNATNYITFVNATSGNIGNRVDSTLTYNPSTNTLSAGTFNGAINGSSGSFSSDLTVNGNLIVNGTTTTVNSTTITVDDINLELGSVATPTDTTANGGGITLKGATDKTITWGSTNGWTSSESINVVTGKTYKINGNDVLSSSTLGSGITNSSLTKVGLSTSGFVKSDVSGNLSVDTNSYSLTSHGHYIGTTAVQNSSANQAISGISSVTLPGSTSGTVQIIPSAVAGTNTILTLPAISGTVITSGDSGTVTNTMLSGSIANSKLSNSSLTVGTTNIALGGSSTTLSGLTSVTSTTFVGSLTGNADTATKLAASKTIQTSLSSTSSASFDGSSNITPGVSGTLGTANGGTGLTSFTSGGAIYASSTSGLTSGTLPISAGGTGSTSAASAITTLTGTQAAGKYLRSDGTNATLSSLSGADLTGTIPSTVLGNSTVYIGTTAVSLNRASGSLALTGITSIDGNAATATLATTATTANALNSANAYTGTSFNSITGLSSTTPVMNGTAAVGTSTTVARADHVHGSDTSKANLSGATFTGAVSGTTFSATTFTGALSGNATTATTLKSVNTTATGTSSWNPQSLTYQAWGQSFINSNISADSGDITYWLRPSQYSAGGTEVCVMIDGDYYSGTGQYKVLNTGNISSYAMTQSAGGAVVENSQTISANYTMTSGKSGMSAGDITIATGVTVTIPSGSRWVIV